MLPLRYVLPFVGAACVLPVAAPRASPGTAEPCPRPAPGAAVAQPRDLRSNNGTLRLELTLRDQPAEDGSIRYCYVLADGGQSPTLRMQPGDQLVLELNNELHDPARQASSSHVHHQGGGTAAPADACTSGTMSLISTNLHFHGLAVPPICHQDDVLKTSIQPGQSFEYKFRIPVDQPPGLYWYHPHIHGFSTSQVMGGASGAIVIEGLERAYPEVAGLPERVLVIRDQDLVNPHASPSKSEPVVPKMMIERDGDSANNGTGFGKPAKDLSINFVPVPYPDYPPAMLEIRPHERQLWRVLNASAITYLNLALIYDRAPQKLGIVAIDGVPLNEGDRSGHAIEWTDHIGLPPGARAEFIMDGPSIGGQALLVTRAVDTGQGGENDPNRALASLVARPGASVPRSLPENTHQRPPSGSRPWIADVPAVRVRKLYFSEKLADPADPNSATAFYLTVDGQTPTPFDPASTEPNIIATQGDVEDWIIENRSTELHAFHIHQLHFLLLGWAGMPVAETFLRDTVNVPYYDGRMLQYPSVRLRMDFRDPSVIGTFVYHCHLLEHEDHGMMGTIRVDPPGGNREAAPAPLRSKR